MSACNVEAIKNIAKYLNTPIKSVCYNTDKVLTAVINKQNVEGFATIVLRLAMETGTQAIPEQMLQCYQWLEHLAMFANQAATNPSFAKTMLQDMNRALEYNSYLTGQFLSVADVAAYHVLYPIVESLSLQERESVLAVSRWLRHVQSLPGVRQARPPLSLQTITLSVLAPVVH